MNDAIRCPRCAQSVREVERCRHLRWAPEQGDPLAFAKFAVKTSPCTAARGARPTSISLAWWESQYDWLLERIVTRLDVIGGYCFADPAALDRLCLDIWHRFESEPEHVRL